MMGQFEPNMFMNLTAGATLQGGKYLINHTLGQTPWSLTFQATQVSLSQPVVLQTLQPQLPVGMDAAQLRRQFRDHVQRFAQCQHPGLAKVLDFFEEGGYPFGVMDCTVGASLTDLVAANGPLAEDVAIAYIRQVGAALVAMHGQGLLHRQLAPESMIRPLGADVMVLMNPGLVYPTENNASVAAIAPGHPYLAPELSQPHGSATPASDLYALATCLVFALTGQPPTPGTNPMQALRQLRPGLSAAVEAALAQGTTPDPNARPQTVSTWLAALPQGATSSQQPVARPLTVSLPLAATNGSDTNGSSTNGIPKDGAATTTGSTATLLSVPAVKPQVAASTSPPASPTERRLTVPPTPTHRNRWFPKFVLMASAIAVCGGLGLGLVLRFAGASGPGSSLFHTEQSFPSTKGWPISVAPSPASDIPATPPNAAEWAPSTPEDPPVIRRQYQPLPEAEPEVLPPEPEPVPTEDTARPKSLTPAPDAAKTADPPAPPVPAPPPLDPILTAPPPAVPANPPAPAPPDVPRTEAAPAPAAPGTDANP